MERMYYYLPLFTDFIESSVNTRFFLLLVDYCFRNLTKIFNIYKFWEYTSHHTMSHNCIIMTLVHLISRIAIT
jgi:hypothetical protein